MWEYFFAVGELVTKFTGQLTHTQWIWLLAGVCGLGLVLLRGFGSRKNY